MNQVLFRQQPHFVVTQRIFQKLNYDKTKCNFFDLSFSMKLVEKTICTNDNDYDKKRKKD